MRRKKSSTPIQQSMKEKVTLYLNLIQFSSFNISPNLTVSTSLNDEAVYT